MTKDLKIIQAPEPGSRMVRFRGDLVTFELTLPAAEKGSAWLRTNIGNAAAARREIFRHVECDETPLGRDWSDIPMNRLDARRFRVTLPLHEVGHFEAKCLFMSDGDMDPAWPPGPNTAVNVEPADTICANIIYNAFVRQFGPNKSGDYFHGVNRDWIHTFDDKGFTVIPPSGTFRDLIREIDFIMGTLGCRIVQLLPIHPTPTTFARMGRYGSPYAALDFTTVDPALAEFDPKATPLDQFIELVDAVHRRNGRIIIDIAVNHTGWGADIHEVQPKWLVRDDEGRIQNPGAWGTVWEDLTQLDYSHKDLWKYIADVFLTWCRRGVDGFRCDAGYMIPEPAWQYVISRVREQFPDTIFLLEGLGGKISVTRSLLNTGNFNWAYSELFQNYDRGQIERYLPDAVGTSLREGLMIHFAETHDNPRLAATSTAYARMRTALCALCACHGGFGFANGVEWFAAEKIVVHESPSLNWGAKDNQIAHIRALSRLLREHPAFSDQTDVSLAGVDDGNTVALLRRHRPSGKTLMVLVNLDTERPASAAWHETCRFNPTACRDLISNRPVLVNKAGDRFRVNLNPAEVLCLADQTEARGSSGTGEENLTAVPEKILQQRFKATALDAICAVDGVTDLDDARLDEAVRILASDPADLCLGLNTASEEPMVVTWEYPRDLKRTVMIPPGHFLLIRSPMPFDSRLVRKNRVLSAKKSLPLKNGTSFALFPPLPCPDSAQRASVVMTVHAPNDDVKKSGEVIYLPAGASSKNPVQVKNLYPKSDVRDAPMVFLSTNGRGAMSRFPLSWGSLQSRYDAFLAANLDPDAPVNRHVMFTRCRAWVVYQGYSQDVNVETLDAFYFAGGEGYWRFEIPTGKGGHVILTIKAGMIPGENAVAMSFFRHAKETRNHGPEDDAPVRLILRPDIENRSFHDVTKAYTGPEHAFPKAVTPRSGGFVFSPDDAHRLTFRISQGDFIVEPEWQYMVHRPLEAQRGLDPDSDLFSPGYFSVLLKGNQRIDLFAGVGTARQPCLPDRTGPDRLGKMVFPERLEPLFLEQALRSAMNAYIVKRKELNSVIAGYPWFLDWGRDALIVVRGIIAAGDTRTARAVIKQFGRYEKNGTLPNMIVGEDVGNRDTSDAPLWFCAACSDLIRHEGSTAFLDEDCGGRNIRDILLAIGNAYATETPNGIRMDPASAMIFSPAHYTWMDTNHPAGTPREGYPVEIQALWYAALNLLARVDGEQPAKKWRGLAERLASSFFEWFPFHEKGYLADCLHAAPGTPVRNAEKDDALRPNQLLAVTTGIVRDKALCRKILAACSELLIPGAIRSLADRPVTHALGIYLRGELLNDPHRPYQGAYAGDEDTRRKPAYHNGTAWTWMFPSFCEAWFTAYGAGSRKTALALLSSSLALVESGCVGHIPEIADGDFPHRERGCDAQAWGVSEALRVLIALKTPPPAKGAESEKMIASEEKTYDRKSGCCSNRNA